jgi:hypothetical protein
VDKLVKTVKSSRRDAATEAWAAQVCEEAVQNAKEVLEEKSTNYTLMNYRKQGQRLSELLMAGRLARYANHGQFKEIKVAVMEEVLCQWREETHL